MIPPTTAAPPTEIAKNSSWSNRSSSEVIPTMKVPAHSTIPRITRITPAVLLRVRERCREALFITRAIANDPPPLPALRLRPTAGTRLRVSSAAEKRLTRLTPRCAGGRKSSKEVATFRLHAEEGADQGRSGLTCEAVLAGKPNRRILTDRFCYRRGRDPCPESNTSR